MNNIKLLDTNIRCIILDEIMWYCCRDIAVALNYNETFTNVFYRCHMNQISTQRFPIESRGGSQQSLFVDMPSLKYLLAKSRKPKVPEMLRELGHDDVIMAPTKEAVYVDQLMKMFPSLKFRHQYSVSGYRVDMYSPRYNIIVECDENGHDNYDIEKEAKRTQKINECLNNPQWIRFNPDAYGFTIVTVIADITTALTSLID